MRVSLIAQPGIRALGLLVEFPFPGQTNGQAQRGERTSGVSWRRMELHISSNSRRIDHGRYPLLLTSRVEDLAGVDSFDRHGWVRRMTGRGWMDGRGVSAEIGQQGRAAAAVAATLTDCRVCACKLDVGALK